jgi:SulP family sulfate permease
MGSRLKGHLPSPALPGLIVVRAYRRSWLRGDLLAGATVAAYLVPQVMAYAGVAGLQPVAGLWAIMPALAVYSLLGSSRRLSFGPESSTAVMTAAAVGPLAVGDPARYAALAAGLAIVVGVMCLLGWAARLGFVADLLSRPILVGYMTGLAVVMIVGQLGRVTGIPVDGQGVVTQLSALVHGVHGVQMVTLATAVAVLAFIVIVQRWFRSLPAPLFAVLLATAVVALLGLDRHGVAVVGDVPAHLPRPSLPHLRLDDLQNLLLPALGVLIVAYSDTVLTGRSFAARDGGTVDADQELLALGVSNLGAGMLQGFPVSSSASRTAMADAAGGRTQLYSLAALALVLAVLLFLGPVLADFPSAALGAIVIYAAGRLIHVGEFRRLAAFRRSELFLAVAATGGVLLLNVLGGIVLAIGLSIAELLMRVSRPHDSILGRVPGLAGMHDVDDYPTAETIPGLVVYRYDSPLFFANAEDFKRRAIAAVEAATEPVAWFILNVEANVEVDITALDALDEVRRELERRGVILALARVKHDLLDDLQASGLVDLIGADRLFPTLPTAVAGYEEWRATRRMCG